jgi:hypothetical protein
VGTRRLLCLAAAAAAAAHPRAAADGGAAADTAAYDPWQYNRVCRYSASNVPSRLFQNGVDAGAEYLFPLEEKRAVDRYERPWEACFGPKETYDLAAIEAGWKLPCKYQVRCAAAAIGRLRARARARMPQAAATCPCAAMQAVQIPPPTLALASRPFSTWILRKITTTDQRQRQLRL